MALTFLSPLNLRRSVRLYRTKFVLLAICTQRRSSRSGQMLVVRLPLPSMHPNFSACRETWLNEYTSPVDSSARDTFELASKQGAALIANYPTHGERIERDRRFVDYIKQHHESWVDFAREKDHPEDVRPILVTGVDSTREFATVAYSDNKTSTECEFSTTLPGVAFTSVSVWGSWHTSGLVHTNRRPDPARQRRGLDNHPAPESEIPDPASSLITGSS